VTGLIDISPVISPDIAVWPGDTPYQRHVALDMRQGDHLTLSAIHSTVHLGAHADGPNHYATDGQAIGARPLELYYGPCQVVSVVIGQGERITPDRISHELTESRVLFKTNTYPDPNHFNEDFAALSPELIETMSLSWKAWCWRVSMTAVTNSSPSPSL
jgi:arylformamidase